MQSNVVVEGVDDVMVFTYGFFISWGQRNLGDFITGNLPKVVKAYSQVTTKPLLKRELDFFSSERDLSQNINKASYV